MLKWTGTSLKKKVKDGVICATYIPTKEQIANIFTKGLPQHNFDEFICKLDMVNIYLPT